jgi:hypothetical protein
MRFRRRKGRPYGIAAGVPVASEPARPVRRRGI